MTRERRRSPSSCEKRPRPAGDKEITDGIFIDRPNRFIAHVDVNGVVETVHVKNTGRCKELLLPGAAVRLEMSGNPKCKTKYDLVMVYNCRATGRLKAAGV